MQDESLKTRPLFDKATEIISEVLTTREVFDRHVVAVALKAFTGHIKVKNTETREKFFNFGWAREVSEDKEQLKDLLSRSIPELTDLLPAPAKKK